MHYHFLAGSWLGVPFSNIINLSNRISILLPYYKSFYFCTCKEDISASKITISAFFGCLF